MHGKECQDFGVPKRPLAPLPQPQNYDKPTLPRQPARSGKHPNPRWRAERFARLHARPGVLGLFIGNRWEVEVTDVGESSIEIQTVDVDAMQRLKLLCRCDDIERIET